MSFIDDIAIKGATTVVVGSLLLAVGIGGAEVWERTLNIGIGPVRLQGLGPALHTLQERAVVVQTVYRDRVIYRQQAAQRITQAAQASAAASQERIRTVYVTKLKEIPAHVTPLADSRCTVTRGTVSVLDDAASHPTSAGVPDAPSGADDAPSGIAISQLDAAVVANYGICNAEIDRLGRLQQWIRDQQAQWRRDPVGPSVTATQP